MSVDLGTISLQFDSGPAKAGADQVVQAVGQIDKAVERTTKTLAQIRAEQDRVASSQRNMAAAIVNAGGDLEKAGREQARALTRGLRQTLQRERADIVELQLRGLLSPQEAAARGQAAGKAFNDGLSRVIAQQGAAGNLQGQVGQSLFTGLTGQAQSIKEIGPAARGASGGIRTLTTSFASLAAQQIGVRSGLGSIVGVLGTMAAGGAVTLGVVIGLTAITAGIRALGKAAREERIKAEELREELERVLQRGDPLRAQGVAATAALERSRQAVLAERTQEQRVAEARARAERADPADAPFAEQIAEAAEQRLKRLTTDRLTAQRIALEEINELRRVGEDLVSRQNKGTETGTRQLETQASILERMSAARVALAETEALVFGNVFNLQNLAIDRQQRALDELLATLGSEFEPQVERIRARLEASRPEAQIARALSPLTPRVALSPLTPRVRITQGAAPLGPQGPDLAALEAEAAAREKQRRALQDTTFAVIAFGQAIAQITGSGSLGRAFGAAAQGAALGSAVAPGIGTAIGAGVGFLGGLFGGDGGAEKRRRQEERDAARAAVRGFVEDIRRAGLDPLSRALDEVSSRFSTVRAEALRVGIPFADAARVAAEEITRLRNEFAAQERQTQQGLRAEILSLSGDEAGGARLELQLRNQREAEQALADGLGLATQGLIEQVGALRESALARQQELDVLRKAAEDAAFEQSLLGREAALRGDALGEARANAEAAAIAQRAEAEELRRTGRIGEGLFVRLSNIIDGEFRQSVERARSALQEAARAQDAARVAVEEDLEVRLLRAQGRGAEADDLSRQIERQRELDRLRDQGVGEETLSFAARVQAEEERMRLAGLTGAGGGRLDQIATTAGLTATTETTSLRIDSSLFTIAFLARDIRDDVRAIRNGARSSGGSVSVVFEGGASADQSRIIDAVTRAVDVGSSQALAITNSASGVRSLA